MQGSRDQESSSLIATVQDIQKRLIRPYSLHSPPPPPISSPKKKKKKKLLEDYLDPVLLSAISSKIGLVKKQKAPLLPEMKNKPKKKLVMVKDFEWPVDELNAFVAADASRSDQVADLNNDFIEEESEESCTPFRRFEQSALKRFKELDQP
ncbi:hypothetical protein SO802_030245 [Lithocarpus litseifolius]|uniref:Uncharacterized protein n=1 Tax=Lithocarpus litseifolius TaxID=425828 RepID=A0AAW2BKI7_9ROSI